MLYQIVEMLDMHTSVTLSTRHLGVDLSDYCLGLFFPPSAPDPVDVEEQNIAALGSAVFANTIIVATAGLALGLYYVNQWADFRLPLLRFDFWH